MTLRLVKDKTHFNDPDPMRWHYELECTSCRAYVNIDVLRYPHGPKEIKACPVCATTETDNLKVVLIGTS